MNTNLSYPPNNNYEFPARDTESKNEDNTESENNTESEDDTLNSYVTSESPTASQNNTSNHPSPPNPSISPLIIHKMNDSVFGLKKDLRAIKNVFIETKTEFTTLFHKYIKFKNYSVYQMKNHLQDVLNKAETDGFTTDVKEKIEKVVQKENSFRFQQVKTNFQRLAYKGRLNKLETKIQEIREERQIEKEMWEKKNKKQLEHLDNMKNAWEARIQKWQKK